MNDQENPYAAPRTTGEADASSRMRPLRHPWLSRTLTAMLVINALALVGTVLILFFIEDVLPDGLNVDRANVVYLATSAVLFWMALAWPVVSLSAVIYTATIDRGTKLWLLKSAIAALMFAAWFFLCLLGSFA